MKSREELVGELSDETERQQYTPLDVSRIEYISTALTQHVIDLIGALGAYKETLAAEVNEDAEADMRYARRALIEEWALSQACLSKVAWTIRLNGDEAFSRATEFLKNEDNNLDMQGL